MRRGGQVTLFVVIGLVLLIAVGIIYAILAKDADDKGSPITGTTNVAVLSNYLGSCVDTAVVKELTLLSRNGGAFDLTPYKTATVSGEKVRYGITRNMDLANTGAMKPYAYPAPQFPDWNVRVERSNLDANGVAFASFQDGYFGDVYFPAICSKTGANRPGQTFTCISYEGNPPGTGGPNVQDELERRVRDGVRGCANLRAFQDAIGQDVERVGDPVVNITFTYANTLVTLTYPVVIKGETTTRLEQFRRDYKVRYLPFAQYVIDLAREETKNVMFDITEDYASIPSYRPGFTVTANRDVTVTDAGLTSDKATLVTVFDANSLLDGESYSLSFLIEHRPPMLSHPLSASDAEDVFDDGYLPDATLIAADPDEGLILITKDRDSFDNIKTITVFDEDGESDWQDFS